MIDRAVLAQRIAAIRDAVERIRDELPATPEALASDRTAREIVVLNLFVAVQECIAIATHWLADDGRDVPSTDGAVFRALAEHGAIDPALASRMATAAGLRNVIAHRYAALDWARIHDVASSDLDDLVAFCQAMAKSGQG
jgi:uncharacterized protein YutE (UPF0331/DUF86 family)